MPINPKNLVRHELMGLQVKVSKSTNLGQRNISGTVIDETYNTLSIETRNGMEKTLIKKNCAFVFKLPDKTRVEVDGKILVGRPEDRIKKKFERW